MLSALLYLQYHSFVNRAVRRVRRLKQPKYLFGAIVGGLYFYFYFGRFLFGFGSHRAGGMPAVRATDGNQVLIESAAALVLLVIVLLAWLLPRERAALVFSEAEVAFLFPAPISRRGLVHFRLIRSQLAVLLTSLILLALTRRWGGNLWFHALGWWAVISTLSLHGLGSSFARTMLLDRGITNRTRRLVILGVVAVAAATVFMWARRTVPAFSAASMEDGTALKRYAEQVLASGPLPCLLFPFRLVIRPFFATTLSAFLAAFGPTLAILLALYWWVIRSDVAFEEASVDASQKLAARLAAVRAGNWGATDKGMKPKRPPFRLHPTGPPAVALLWKHIISASKVFTGRLWLILAIGITCLCVCIGQMNPTGGLATVIGMLSGMALSWSLLVGPQILRQDFRQDLLLADVLKTYPIPPWQMALGELLGPVVILTAVDWLLVLVAGILLGQTRGLEMSGALVASIALGVAVVIPMLNLIVFQIPNAAALLFPAWFLATRSGPGGIEAMGQRLIFFIGQFLVLVLALVPAAVVFTGLFFLGKLFVSPAFIIPRAALGTAVVLGVEASFGMVLLGRLFSRFDVASEMTP